MMITARLLIISLEEEARLELQGARARHEKALQELRDFYNWERWNHSYNPDTQPTLAREKHALQVEADDAARQLEKARQDLHQLTKERRS